ncbi:hypothetical protein NDU88_002740 [Pleurodeles waltl]|uniref:Uncharacterized protein n=1 Tax=Pleurodeles waltl TaxID=8319 RepID=A0AAV7W066_PLEWA|nr:hypothetical protein NDU88_002740 [Pleurodeles waltl]
MGCLLCVLGRLGGDRHCRPGAAWGAGGRAASQPRGPDWRTLRGGAASHGAAVSWRGRLSPPSQGLISGRVGPRPQHRWGTGAPRFWAGVQGTACRSGAPWAGLQVAGQFAARSGA